MSRENFAYALYSLYILIDTVDSICNKTALSKPLVIYIGKKEQNGVNRATSAWLWAMEAGGQADEYWAPALEG